VIESFGRRGGSEWRTRASFIGKQTDVTSSPGSPSICGSRGSSIYWAMSIQQRRASFVRRNQTGRQTKKLDGKVHMAVETLAETEPLGDLVLKACNDRCRRSTYGRSGICRRADPNLRASPQSTAKLICIGYRFGRPHQRRHSSLAGIHWIAAARFYHRVRRSGQGDSSVRAAVDPAPVRARCYNCRLLQQYLPEPAVSNRSRTAPSPSLVNSSVTVRQLLGARSTFIFVAFLARSRPMSRRRSSRRVLRAAKQVLKFL
jgi:hypothetical protein